MAAHVLTGLKDILASENPELPAVIHAACLVSTWTEDLEYEQWNEFFTCETVEKAKALATSFLPQYEAEWKSLGEPRTREEWLRTKFNL